MPWKIVSSESDPTAPRTLLEYDSMHQRVAKRGPEKTTIYAGDLYECEGTTPWSGNTVSCSTERFKIYGAGKLVAVVTKGDYTNDTGFVHSDRLGSSSLITDVQGKQVQGGDFDAFGAPKGIDFTSTGIKSGFTGQEYDAELNLINMGGRLYDPAIGRFITADPFVSRPFDPQGLNRFSYVQNNPLNATDPSGFFYEGNGGGGYNGGYSGSYSGGGVGGQGSSGSGAPSGPGGSSAGSPAGQSIGSEGSGMPAGAAAPEEGEPPENRAAYIAAQQQINASQSISSTPSATPITSPQGGAGTGWAYAGPSGGGSSPGYGNNGGSEGASSGALKAASSNAAVASSGGPSWSPGANGSASSYGGGQGSSNGGYGGGPSQGGQPSDGNPGPGNRHSPYAGTYGSDAMYAAGVTASFIQYSHVQGNMWRFPTNGNWQSNEWHGNQYGKQSTVVGTAQAAEKIGKGLFWIGFGVSLTNALASFDDGRTGEGVKSLVNIAFSAIGTFCGPIGAAVGAGYGFFDVTASMMGGWGNLATVSSMPVAPSYGSYRPF